MNPRNPVSFVRVSLLPITHYLLPIPYYLLPITHYLLPTAVFIAVRYSSEPRGEWPFAPRPFGRMAIRPYCCITHYLTPKYETINN